jgi:hypothetical protein
VLAEVVERDAELAPVDELEGEVMHVGEALVEQREDVVVAVDVQPAALVADPVGHREPDPLVPRDHARDVGGEVVHVLDPARAERGEHVGEPGDRRRPVRVADALDEQDAVAVRVGQAQAAPADRHVDDLALAEQRHVLQADPGAQLVRRVLEAGCGVAGRDELEREVLVGAAQQAGARLAGEARTGATTARRPPRRRARAGARGAAAGRCRSPALADRLDVAVEVERVAAALAADARVLRAAERASRGRARRSS